MEGFRQLIKGWLGKVLLGIVVFVFVIYGAESLMVIASRPKPVAEVNGQDVSREQLEARVEQYRRAQQARLGERASEVDLSAEKLAPEVLNSIVDRMILSQRTGALSMAASDLAAKRWITTMPEFQRDGQFSEELFKSAIMRAGYTPKQLIREVQSDHVLRQLQEGLADSFFMTEDEVKRLIALQEQSRSFAYAVLKPDRFMDEVTIKEPELQAYYDQNQSLFSVEDRARFEFVVLEASQFETDETVTDEALQAAYKAEVAKIEAGEQRRASHILISPEVDGDSPEAAEQADLVAKARIETIKAEIDKGGDFAQLARENSMDPGSKQAGGDLGFSTKGAMVPAFDEALFALSEGEVSDVVKTRFGYHLIQLHEIKTAEKPDFDSIKSRLAEQIREEQARAKFEEKVDELGTLAYESGDLTPLTEAFGLDIAVSDWVSRSKGSGLFADTQVLKTAFSNEVLKDGFNSDAINLGDGRALVFRMKEYEPAFVKPLAQVMDQVRDAVKRQKASELATKRGREIVASLRANENRETVSTKHNLTWRLEDDVKRFSMVVPQALVQKAFELSKTKSETDRQYGGTVLDDGFAIVELTAVKAQESEMSADEVANMRQFLTQQLGQQEIQFYLDFHKNRADLEVNL